ncbi:MAG: arginine--tRNA ligase [Vulcanimicrobiaceae bacterium]
MRLDGTAGERNSPDDGLACELAPLAGALARAAGELLAEGAAPGESALPAVDFEPARNPAFGDFATNVAFGLARRARRSPQALAEALLARVREREPEAAALLAEAQAVAGFINVRLAPSVWQQGVARILREGAAFGREQPSGERISLEFGSANPTGPLVVVQGRTLSLGDSLARAMRFCGIAVESEWIVNDAGSQIENLGRSLFARYRQLADPSFPFPDDGYPGAYLIPLAERLRARDGDRWERASEAEALPVLARFARDALVAEQQEIAARFGVHYDRWQSERELHESGAIAQALAGLRARDLAYEAEGALWLRTTAFGDDKDRVLVRADGRPTYLAPDVAFHAQKLARAEHAILILGPDHHGYIKRLETIAAALGRAGAIEVVIAQHMTTIRDGEIVSLSKRHGDLLTLAEVIDEVGVDAARFFFAMTSPEQPLTFDLTLAKERSNENPVFYVQYAHARIASLARSAPAELRARAERGEELARLTAAEERALARRLAEFPGTVRAVVRGRAPHRLTRYLQTLAGDFTQFYGACRVLSSDAGLSAARLGLAFAAQRVLASGLQLLGVTAPQTM